MITLIKNIETYSPDSLGQNDILITAGTIAAVREEINLDNDLPELKVIDGKELIAVPGFIDNHVHITGGGGEGGFETRTPEINVTDLFAAGVTSVIGVRGTDGFSRSMENLVAKAKGLRKQGVSCWVLTGSYQMPIRTLTDSVESDILFIEEIIGVGEIAIADHRSSHASVHELIKVVASARIGGILSGKSGVTNIHLGDGKNGFATVRQITQESDVPIHHLIPTHVNRNYELLCDGFAYARDGGFIDLTASGYIEGRDDPRTKCSHALKLALAQKINPAAISMSSDGQGSLPIFNSEGHITGYSIGSCHCLLDEVADAVHIEGIPLQTAIATITRNPARIYGLNKKGEIGAGMDADIVLLTKNLTIHSVLSAGKMRLTAN